MVRLKDEKLILRPPNVLFSPLRVQEKERTQGGKEKISTTLSPSIHEQLLSLTSLNRAYLLTIASWEALHLHGLGLNPCY